MTADYRGSRKCHRLVVDSRPRELSNYLRVSGTVGVVGEESEHQKRKAEYANYQRERSHRVNVLVGEFSGP